MCAHTPECQAAIDADEKQRADWIARWPNYCRGCNGYGALGWPDDGDISIDFCDHCIGKWCCPRCGEMTIEGTGVEARCATCGWKLASPDGCPPEPECFCWADLSADEERERRALREKSQARRAAGQIPPDYDGDSP